MTESLRDVESQLRQEFACRGEIFDTNYTVFSHETLDQALTRYIEENPANKIPDED